MDIVDSSVLAEEEVILWVTSDLCSSTTVTSTPVEGTIPVTLFRGENLVQENVAPVQFTESKEEQQFYITEEDVGESKEKKSRKRGVVWNYFVPTVPDRAKCTFCSTEISYKSKSTNNLLRHLRTKHSDLNALSIDMSEIVERKIESCVAEDGSTYYVLSTPVDQPPSPAHSHSSFQAEDDPAKNIKRRGGVWRYFLTDSKQRAKCKFCGTIISYKGGSTTNLLRHMKSKHAGIRMHHNKLSTPVDNSLSVQSATSIQHSFAEIVSECVKSDDENEFQNGIHYSETTKEKADVENITILSSMDPNFTQNIEIQQFSETNECNEPVKERRKSAIAWKYFTMENEERAKCGTCCAVISFKGGSTGNLLRHLKTKHSEIDLTPPVKVEEQPEPSPEDEQPAFEAIENKELAKFVQLLNPTYKLQGATVPRLGDRELPKRLRKRGSAFSYFNIKADEESGTCQLCGTTVTLKNGSKAPLLRHLKAKHPETDTMLVSVSGSNEEVGSSSQFVNVEDIENIPVQVSPNNESSNKEKATRKMRKRGLVWNHFAPLEDEKAKCNVCPAVISYKRGSTSNLLRHMKKKHPEVDVHDEDPLKADLMEEGSEDDDDEDYVPENESNKKVLRKRGRVWNYFKPTQPDKAKCSLCNLVVVYLKGSTTNLLRHMKKKHPAIDLLKEKPLNRCLTYPREKSSSSTSSTLQLKLAPASSSVADEDLSTSSASASGTPTVSSSSDKVNAIYRRSEIIFRKHFDKFLNRPVSVTKSKQYDEQLAKMIVKQYCPFTIVESDEFRKFVQTVNPGYSLPSRKTISSRLIPELYEKCVDEVRERLRRIKYVTITTNGWTLVNNECYVSMTAHFIDEECELQSYLLDCFKYEENYTAEDLSATMKKILTEWNLLEKVNAVVSDNTANVTAAIGLLSWPHIPCFADMVNTVVVSSLTEIHELQERVRVIGDFFKNNNLASKKLASTLKEMDLPETKLKPCDPSKWTSIYNLINKLILCKNAIVAILDTFVENVQSPNEYEWSLLERTCSILKPLFDITNELSEKNVTVSKVIPLSKCVANYLRKTLQDQFLAKELVVFVEKMLQEVTLKFSDVEDTILLAESTFLDPRFKNQAFGNDQSYANVYHSILQQACAVQLCDDAYEKKEQNDNGSVKKELSASASNVNNDSNIWEEFDSRVVHLNDLQNPETAATTELENFLQESLISRTADPLVWWRERKSIYPKLFEIMKRKLCIAATAVSKNFTNSGQLVCEKRNKLSSSKVSMVLFLNHNL